MCHFVPLLFAIFEVASWFYFPRIWHLSERWTTPSGFYRLPENRSSFQQGNSVEIGISDNLKVQDGGWGRTSQPSCTNFCRVCNETWGLTLSWWKMTSFRFVNFGRFSSIAAFSRFNWEQYLSEFIVWLCEGVRNTRCPSNPIRYTTSPSSDADRLLERLMVAHIVFSKIFSVPYWCKQSIFHCPWLFVSKIDHFRCIWAKNCRWKCGPLNFFPSNCEAPKHRNDLCTRVSLNAL